MLVCKFCSRNFTRPCSLVVHEKACHQNPARIPGKNHYSYGAKISENTRQKLSEISKKRTISDEIRNKISKSRIRYLKENPDKVPYVLNHKSKGESFPEKYWKKILVDANIEFEQEKQVSIYRLDFAINGILDLEIDGEQHYLDPRILASNQRRDGELRSKGWEILRIRWSDFQRMSDLSRKDFVEIILQKCRLVSTVNR